MKLTILFLLLSGTALAQTHLEKVINSIQPGTFAVLNQDGDGSGYDTNLLCYDGIGCMTGFATKAVYDPIKNRVHFTGTPHSGTTHHIIYDIATNKWSGSSIESYVHLSHTYDGNAININTREHLVISDNIPHRMNLDTGIWANPLPPCPITMGYQYSLEFFPDRDELLCLSFKQFYRIKAPYTAWELIADNTTLGALQTHFTYARYNQLHGAVLITGGYDYSTFGGASGFSHALFKYDKDGVITRLKDSPANITAGSNTGLVISDPASGEFLFLNAVMTPEGNPVGKYTFYSYNWVTEIWTDRTSILPSGMAAVEGSVFALLPIPVSKYGVTLWMGASEIKGNSKIHVYKHSNAGQPPDPPDPPVPPTDFVTKCAQQGVLACWGFDSESDLKYAWDTTQPALDKAMAGKQWHTVSNDRGSTEGNTVPIEHVSGALSIPIIDKTKFASGGGSLRLNVPSQSEPNSGWFQDNINKILGNPSAYIAPGSPLGNVLYGQFKFMPSDILMNTVYREPEATISYTLFTSAAGSLTVNNSYDVFTPIMVGRPIAVQGPYIMSPWVKGIYTIKSVIDSRTITLDRSPTPTSAGITGLGVVGGADTPDYKGGGWKVIILFGNSPLGASSSPTEITMVNPKQVGIPTMYGQQGLDGYGWQDMLMCSWQWLDPGLTFNPALYTEPPCKRFKPNKFVEFTIRIEVRGAPNEPASRVQVWMDGEPFVDYGQARINWCPDSTCPNGVGQFDLLLYHTRKDPTQVTPEAFAWYDDVIFSRLPITMSGEVVPEPPPVNIAPSCNTIPNQTVTLPEVATLAAICTDDGLPTGQLTGNWSAPNVIFGSPNSSTTTAIAPAGTYNVTYKASDGVLETIKTMTLIFNPATIPPVDDPCVITPLTLSGLKWPTQRVGSRSFSWNSQNQEIVSVDYKWPLTDKTPSAIFTDRRGCKAEYRK